MNVTATSAGVSSYSFARYLGSDKLDLLGVVKMAKEIGFDGIEFTALKLPPGETDPLAFAPRVKAACAAAGLPIISYTIGADFLSPREGGDWKDEVKRLKQELKIASALGADRMRHDGTRGFPAGHPGPADYAAALTILKQGCRTVTEAAADLGIKTMVENHGFFVQASERCQALAEAVNHPNFGLLVDMGNFLCVDEDPVQAVTRTASYALHVHAKDFHTKPAQTDPGKGWFCTLGKNWIRGSIVGHGNVDVPGCIRALKAAGFKGWFSIEFEGLEDNRQALEIGLENLRRYLQAG